MQQIASLEIPEELEKRNMEVLNNLALAKIGPNNIRKIKAISQST